MSTQSLPLLSVQAPKDVSISAIEAELDGIWRSYNSGDENGEIPIASRASTFTLIIYEPEETQYLLAVLKFYSGPIDGIAGPATESALKVAQKAYGLTVTGKADPETLAKLREAVAKKEQAGAEIPVDQPIQSETKLRVADAIAAANPCRIIALVPTSGEDEGVTAQVSAYCPINKRNQNRLICCEYITLTGTVAALERIAGVVEALTIGELPKFLWWKAAPDANNLLFKRLSNVCSSVIIDSSFFGEPETDLIHAQALVSQGLPIADLNWSRLGAWQELTAEAFDPPERRDAIMEVDRVTIDYEKGNPAQALLFLGWLASRLQWRPISIERELGETKADYDITRVKFFMAEQQRSIEAELAGAPTADVGEVAGDLVGLRLSSTNLQADCCTVLCSETTGCMRMEAGGGAQACRIQQVTPLTDQKAEFLLSQQLRQSGSDVLYQESLVVTAQILQLPV
ncbi:glucose-6-phosphate dehydrogenase assembly protein OpcA [Merismopedia glauca]|uniref:Glucose-6-phosphate dehydrogenase assembly protein OpcA n=1 Tax=Merismopedia glauca CCAP 1448/3 TaxID=1296344 RepID=A0A2T1C4I4_9CYAN|nr:glucose-6-phosphate dehydrogenase assembly protein OpcA [Merismopedia glauca]PSB03169.1 glucose-6-phosphate dehydrogenase assembly protein OpcA [Merismopedia glauca CCAP 1448/3]